MKSRTDHKTTLRYIVFQIPSLILLTALLLILRSFIPLSSFTIGAIIGAWILKDLLLFPFMKRYYMKSYSRPGENLIGREGHVTSDLDPEGYIRIGMELWRALPCDDTEKFRPGDRAVVTALEGLTLFVKKYRGD